MSANQLIFEIGTEELPSESVYRGLDQLKERASKLFDEARLSFSSLETFATPRRLLLSVKDLSEKQTVQTTKVKGPSLKVAFDSDGKPTAAALGFCSSQKIDLSELEIVETENGSYVYAVRTEDEADAIDILPGLLIELIKTMSFAKPMRWQVTSNLTFPRPIRWLLAILGDRVINLTFGELKSGPFTYGHRILSDGAIKIDKASDYFSKIEAAKVILDPLKRLKIIQDGVKAVLNQGETAKINPKTISEVVNLVEFPTVVCANFSPDYLSIPKKVLVTAMESHQRYFPVENEQGNLMSKFVLVHNADPAALDNIKRGHQRVISARLADAKFFYQEDIKRPLADSLEKLKGVVFQERLGSVYSKALRLEKIAEFLTGPIGVDQLTKKAKRAALLAKADLVSDMVAEFPELQGVMGKEYATVSKEDEDVALAIYEHYLPKNLEGELPSSLLGSILSIADKADTIVGCFAVGLLPTGSQDPYALRRQTQAIVAILLAKEIDISVSDLIDEALRLYKTEGIRFKKELSKVKEEIMEFFDGRIKQHFSLLGHAADTIDAVLAIGQGRLDIIKKKIELLSEKRDAEFISDIVVPYNRCKNLSQGQLGTLLDSSLLGQAEEKELFNLLENIRPEVAKLSADGDFERLLNLLATLKEPIDSFFEAVLVMDKEDRIKENRIKLLNLAAATYESFADFSHLIISGEQIRSS